MISAKIKNRTNKIKRMDKFTRPKPRRPPMVNTDGISTKRGLPNEENNFSEKTTQDELESYDQLMREVKNMDTSVKAPIPASEQFEIDNRLLEEMEINYDREVILEKISSNKANKFIIESIFDDISQLAKQEASAPFIQQTDILEKILVYKGKLKVLKLSSAEYNIDIFFYVFCFEDWATFVYQEEDPINIFGQFDIDAHYIFLRKLKSVPESFNDIPFAILDPSIHIKVTSLTDNFRDCTRYKQLSSFFQERNSQNKYGLEGTIQHSLFEEIISETRELSFKEINVLIDKKMEEQIYHLYELKIDLHELRQNLVEASSSLNNWKRKYISQGNTLFQNEGISIKLIKVDSIEKRYVSDLYGLVGIVDAVLQCEMTTKQDGQVTRLIPFELKTGRKVKIGYQSQVILYNLMMAEREQLDHPFGILYYSNIKMEPVITSNNAKRIYNALDLRNRMVSLEKTVKNQFSDLSNFLIAPRTKNTDECRYCPQKQYCVNINVLEKAFPSKQSRLELITAEINKNEGMVDKVSGLAECRSTTPKRNRKKLELSFEEESPTQIKNTKIGVEVNDGGSPLLDDLDQLLEDYESSQFVELSDLITEEEPKFDGFEDIFKNLTKPKIDYLALWIDRILNEQNVKAKKATLGNTIILQLDCLDRIKLVLSESHIASKEYSSTSTLVEFSCLADRGMLNSTLIDRMSINSRISLRHSSSDVRLSGTLKSKEVKKRKIGEKIRFEQLKILVEYNSYHLRKKLSPYLGKQSGKNTGSFEIGWEYRFRHFDFFNKMRGNISSLISKEENDRLSEYLIGLKKPKEEELEINLEELMAPKTVNEDQKRAILRTLKTDSFSLISGLPGTGKTRTICILLDILIKLGKRVLVTSFTHSSLDNIIVKFMEMYKEQIPKISRITVSKSSLKKKVEPVTHKQSRLKKFEDIQNFLKKRQIFFTTCLSMHDPLLHYQKFDYVIVDETSQIVEPNLLDCLFKAIKFVLIGDYLQLSPLVRSPEAQIRGMAISLLERLCLAHPDWVINLTEQVTKTIFIHFLLLLVTILVPIS